MVVFGAMIFVVCIYSFVSKKERYLYVGKIDDKYVEVESNSEGRGIIYYFGTVDNN